MWFRKGLRFHDNPALLQACEGARNVYPVFVLDPWFLAPDPSAPSPGSRLVGVNRIRFLLESLQDLDTSLRNCGSRLLLIHGSPVSIIPHLLTKVHTILSSIAANCKTYANICKHMHTTCKAHAKHIPFSSYCFLRCLVTTTSIWPSSFYLSLDSGVFFVYRILQWQIDELCFEHDTEPYAQERDAQIKVHISSCRRRFLFSDLQMEWFDDDPDHQRNVWSQICDVARRWFTDKLNTNGLMGVILITNCRNNHGTWDIGSSCFLICKPNGVMTILLITAGVITDLGHSKTIIHLRFESHKQLMQVLWF